MEKVALVGRRTVDINDTRTRWRWIVSHQYDRNSARKKNFLSGWWFFPACFRFFFLSLLLIWSQCIWCARVVMLTPQNAFGVINEQTASISLIAHNALCRYVHFLLALRPFIAGEAAERESSSAERYTFYVAWQYTRCRSYLPSFSNLFLSPNERQCVARCQSSAHNSRRHHSISAQIDPMINNMAILVVYLCCPTNGPAPIVGN